MVRDFAELKAGDLLGLEKEKDLSQDERVYFRVLSVSLQNDSFEYELIYKGSVKSKSKWDSGSGSLQTLIKHSPFYRVAIKNNNSYELTPTIFRTKEEAQAFYKDQEIFFDPKMGANGEFMLPAV